MKQLVFIFCMLLVQASVTAQKVDTKNIIIWSKTTPLKISNFKIVGDTANLNFIRSNNMAVTRSGITYAIAELKANTFEIKLYTTMHPSNSYIRESVLKQSQTNIDYLLKHEQNHFDISEIYAREAARLLVETSFSKNFIVEIRKLMQGVFERSEAFQDEYDAATRNGRDKEAQLQWNNNIANKLIETAPYRRTTIIKSIK